MMMSITFDTSASNWYSSPVEAEVSSATAASATKVGDRRPLRRGGGARARERAFWASSRA